MPVSPPRSTARRLRPPVSRGPAGRPAARPRGTAVFVTAATAAALTVAGGPRAVAAESATSASGGTLTVSKAKDLDPGGETVTVTGTGFGRVRDNGYNGIYVSLCQSQGAGKLATPCVGGVDMEGASGSSLWIGDKVPSYGAGLAQPFNKGAGGFEYQLTLKAKDEFVDCTKVTCVVQVRADHTSSGDRKDDAVVQVTWASGAAASGGAATTTTTSGASAGTTGATGTDATPTAAAGQQTAAAGGTSGGSTSGGSTTAAAADSLPKTGGNERAVALAFGAAALVAAGLAVVLITFRRRNSPGASAA